MGVALRARVPIERALHSVGALFDLVETAGPGDATAQAHEAAAEGYDAIVAVGGDGTAHEVVTGLVEASKASGGWHAGRPCGPLAVIPIGTGNDYAWRLGIPANDVDAACRVLISGRRRRVDLGQVVDEYGRVEIFNNHLGSGFEAATAIESLKIRRFRGLLLYLVAGLRAIPQYSKGRLATIRYGDQVQTRRILLASVANGGRTGGGFNIAPDARLDDGQLDLVLADSSNVATILYLLPHFLAGTHVHQKRYVALDRTRHVVIEAPDGIPVHLDGEIFRSDTRRLEVTVLPGRLEVVGT